MATRYFNWKLAIVLVVAVGVFVVAVFGLHRWQKSTKAEQALPRGQKAFELKQWDEAADQLGRYLAVNNQDVPVLIRYAEAQLNRRPPTQGNIQMAIAAYRNALRLKSDDVDTARRLAEVYLAIGASPEAESTAQRHLERRDDPGLRRVYAQALWRQRKFDQAVAEIKTVIEKCPGDIAAYEFMGFATDDRPEAADRTAVAWLDEAVTKNPQSALAYAARAGYCLSHGNKDQATADLTRALACDLSDTTTRLRVVRELMNAKAWDQARAQLDLLQEIDANEPRLWQTRAEVAVENGSQEEMYKVAEDGMKTLASYPWEFMPVATHLLILSGHLEKVEGYLSQMKSKDIDPPGTAYLEGLLAERQGRLRDAVGHWQRAISLGTRIPEEVYRQMAQALSRLGDTGAAITQLQILLSKSPATQPRVSSAPRPEYIRARLLLAQLYGRTGNWPRAQEQTREILAVAGNYPDVKLEAMLLELQARTNLLAAAGDAGARQDAWRDIETRLAELDKDTLGASAVKLLAVQVAMAQKKFSDAAALLSELESKSPSDLRLMLRRVELCIAQGQEAEAGTLLQNAIAKFPQAVEPVRALALFLNAKNQRSECESVIKEALSRIEEPQPRRDLGLLLSEFYFRWQEKEKLCQWLTDMTTEFPNDIQAKRLLLACESVAKDTARSQKIIDEIKSLEGEKGSQWRYEQARLLLRSVRLEKENKEENKATYPQIVKFLQENLLTNPEDQASRLLLANAYETAGEYKLALATYREAYARTPNDTQVLVRFVNALHKAGEYDEAQGVLDRAGQQDLTPPSLQRLQLDNDFQRGDLDSASSTLQQLVEQDPNDAMLRLSYARVLVLRKEFAKAETILADLKAKQPDSILVARAQVRLYVQQGNTDKALQICNEMVEKLHNADAYLLRVEMYIDLRQTDKALEDLGQAITLEPQNVRPWEARARIYTAMGRTADAISDVRRALTLAPKERRLPLQKLAATLFMASGKQALMTEAENTLDSALAEQTGSVDKGDPELMQLKAQLLIMRGTGPAIEQARQLLRQVTTDYPKYTRGWEAIVQLELQQEDPGKAMDYATRGLAHVESDPKTGEPVKSEENRRLLLLKAAAEKRLSPSVAALTTLPTLAAQYPNDVGILIEWADAYARAGRSEKAIELLNGKLNSFTGAARRRCEIALAAAMYNSQQRDEAKKVFERLITSEPNDPTPVMTLGQLLRKERRWTEVNQLVTLWRTTNPKDADTATNIARILAGSGDREALQMAEDQLRMILDPNPDSVPTLLLLGMLMQDAGRDDEATRLNRRILTLDPNNVISLNNLAWMLCESSSATPASMQEALQMADRGLKLVPEYMDLLDTRGVVQYRLGNMERSEADLRKCIELFPAYSPQCAAPQFHLARTYASLNRRAEALEHLKAALSLNGKNIQLASDHAAAGRRTHAIKVLRDAISLQDEMDQFKTGFDSQDLVGTASGDWTEARLLLDQLQKGLK
ncbi:MAG: tetratricopeptide repeat protein [Solirubrobacterales bacterium]